MIFAYRLKGRCLEPALTGQGLLTEGAPVTVPADAIWIDLFRPLASHVAAVESYGVKVPTLAEMEEIEISNRLYRVDDVDYLTVVLPGQSPDREPVAGPVTFILTRDRLITVRHHAPRPFETFPTRAERGSAGCAGPERLFLSLAEEIVGRLADLLEGAGRKLDEAARGVLGGGGGAQATLLRTTLEEVGQQGELISRVRLGVMTMERALSFFGTSPRADALKPIVKALMRDLNAIAVHADFLSSRVGLTVDATLGMINLAQNATARIFSFVAVVFLPPTLVASAYGMNFEWMPGLHGAWGYPMALGLMLASAIGTYLFFKWKEWL
ncbi:MAG: magnesium transporter CorA family protein [Albidovulum sp.]